MEIVSTIRLSFLFCSELHNGGLRLKIAECGWEVIYSTPCPLKSPISGHKVKHLRRFWGRCAIVTGRAANRTALSPQNLHRPAAKGPKKTSSQQASFKPAIRSPNMIIAHLPAGYLAARRLQKQKHDTTAFCALLLGSLFPDFDMLYFYTIGQTQIHHHRYITHIPAYYAGAGTVTGTALLLLNKTRLLKWLVFFLAGVMLHLALDSFVGWIYWLKPFSDAKIGGHIFVDAKYDWWIWNFVFHWTMLIELTIVSFAGWAFIADWRANRWGQSET